MGELRKVKAKLLFWRVLKVVFYAAGIPLLHYFVRLSIGDYPVGENAYAGTAKTLLLILNIGWIAVAVVQIICALIFKSKRTKALIASILAVAIVIAPIVYVEGFLKQSFIKTRAEIKAEYNVDIQTWEKLALNYEGVAEAYNTSIDDFCEYFNIEYKSSQAGGNTDGSDTKEDKKIDAFLSPNGMYSDGYIFGFKQARKVMEDYYRGRDKYLDLAFSKVVKDGKTIVKETKNLTAAEKADKTTVALNPIFNVNVMLDRELIAMSQNRNSEWNKYVKGTSDKYVATANEYDLAYGKDGTARKYYVTEERLDAILGVLGTQLSKSKLKEIIDDLAGMISSFLPGLDADMLTGLVSPDLNIDMVNELLASLGIQLPGGASLLELLAQFSNYQSPTTYPQMYFIEDDVLRDYAYARYYGITHGAKVGSVLISESEKDPMVGAVTFSTNGNPAKSENEIKAIFRQMDIGEKYIPKFLPWFCGRNYFYIFSGVVAFSMAAAYFCAYKEKKQFDKLTLKKEDNK